MILSRPALSSPESSLITMSAGAYMPIDGVVSQSMIAAQLTPRICMCSIETLVSSLTAFNESRQETPGEGESHVVYMTSKLQVRGELDWTITDDVASLKAFRDERQGKLVSGLAPLLPVAARCRSYKVIKYILEECLDDPAAHSVQAVYDATGSLQLQAPPVVSLRVHLSGASYLTHLLTELFEGWFSDEGVEYWRNLHLRALLGGVVRRDPIVANNSNGTSSSSSGPAPSFDSAENHKQPTLATDEDLLDILSKLAPYFRDAVSSPSWGQNYSISTAVVKLTGNILDFVKDHMVELGPSDRTWRDFFPWAFEADVPVRAANMLNVPADLASLAAAARPREKMNLAPRLFLNLLDYPTLTDETRRLIIDAYVLKIHRRFKDISFYLELEKQGFETVTRDLVGYLLEFSEQFDAHQRPRWYRATATTTDRRQTFRAVRRVLEKLPDEPPTAVELANTIELCKHSLTWSSTVTKPTGTVTTMDALWLPMRSARGLVKLLIHQGADYSSDLVKLAVLGQQQDKLVYEPYKGFANDIREVKYWRRWSDNQSIGALPEEVLREIMMMVWEHDCILPEPPAPASGLSITVDMDIADDPWDGDDDEEPDDDDEGDDESDRGSVD